MLDSGAPVAQVERNCERPCSQFPVPKPEGDPWEICLEPLLRKERAQCDAWKDEIQNLLIFAGLFSAVVTAFIAESYKTLQLDPNEVTVQLLSQISARLANATTLPPASPPFTPTRSAIRINLFWFLSLTVSLSTVMVGIVALQWIREYRRYTDDWIGKEAVAAHNMRTEGLRKWYVPQIIAGLPLLLQGSLLLFFGGVIEFLLSLHFTVAIPVTVFVLLTLSFVVITSTLPGLQLVSGMEIPIGRPQSDPPSQCPYKSPLSWIFYKFITAWHPLCQTLHLLSVSFRRTFLYLRNIFPHEASECNRDARLADATYSSSLRGWMGNFYSLVRAASDWTEFDHDWLDFRNTYSRRYCQQFAKDVAHDAACAVVQIASRYGRREAVAYAAYHCFEDLPATLVQDDANVRSNISEAVCRANPGRRFGEITPVTRKASRADDFLAQEGRRILFINILPWQGYRTDFGNVFAKHRLEMLLRILADIFAGPWKASTLEPAPSQVQGPGSLAVLNAPRFSDVLLSVEPDFRRVVVESFLVIWKSFTEVATSTTMQSTRLGEYHHPIDLEYFIHAAADTTLTQVYTRTREGFSELAKAHNMIAHHLKNPKSNYLFHCAALYLEKFRLRMDDIDRYDQPLCDSIWTLYRAVREFEADAMTRRDPLWVLGGWKRLSGPQWQVLNDHVETVRREQRP